MYFERILKINDNKHLVLIVIEIDEIGFISYENPIIFSLLLILIKHLLLFKKIFIHIVQLKDWIIGAY